MSLETFVASVDAAHQRAARLVELGVRVYLEGPPGVGKTFGVLRGLGEAAEYVCGHAQLGPEDVIGQLVDVGRWADGPAARAYRSGAPLLIDEAARAAGSAAADAILSVTAASDVARLSIVPTGEVLRQPEGWRCVAAGNAPHDTLGDALADRFPVVVRIAGPSSVMLAALACEPLARLVAAGYEQSAEKGGGAPPPVSYRLAQEIARLTRAGEALEGALRLALGDAGPVAEWATRELAR